MPSDKNSTRFSPMPIDFVKDGRLSAADWRLLMALYFRDGPKGCFPSRADLSELTGLRMDQITRSTKRLTEFGYLKREGRNFVLLERGNSASFSECKRGNSASPKEAILPPKEAILPSKGGNSASRNRTEENNDKNREEERGARAREKVYPPDNFIPTVATQQQITGKFQAVPNVVDQLLERFKCVEFLEPSDWQRRFYAFALEHGPKLANGHSGGGKSQQKIDNSINATKGFLNG